MTKTNTTKLALLSAALFLGATGAANALTSNSIVKFSVDMNVSGAPSSTMVVNGTFNNWGNAPGVPLTLTQDGITGVWTNTTTVTNLANGGVMSYKFVKDGTWENVASFQNRAARLPAASGATLILPTPFFGDGGTPVAANVGFQVDMAQQFNTGAFNVGTNLYVRGNFNGWGTTDMLTNDPTILRTNQYGLVTSNVYTGTITMSASPNAAMDFKYFFNNGVDRWDQPNGTNQDSGGNRFFMLDVNGSTNPVVFFDDSAFSPVGTNTVVFRVDMAAQILATNFIPNVDTVEVRGGFNSWNGTQLFPDVVNTNIYTNAIVITDGVGVLAQYKFYASGSLGYENPNPNLSPTLPPNNNRYFAQTATATNYLPVVNFSDQSANDLLQTDVIVSFEVDMFGATPTGGGAIFDPTASDVYLNGNFVNWNNGVWNPISLSGAGLKMTNFPVGTSSNYIWSGLIPRGKPLQILYKYSIDGADNEAPSGQDRARYVRRTATGSYPFSKDTFGFQYQEPSFGQLSAAAASGGKVPISWLGRPGVHLQTMSNSVTTVVPWFDYFATSGTNWVNGYFTTNGFVSVTNYPGNSVNRYFRLVKPQF
jgi:hypothetical protein